MIGDWGGSYGMTAEGGLGLDFYFFYMDTDRCRPARWFLTPAHMKLWLRKGKKRK